MPKPSDDLSDEQLHQGLASGDYEGRDALVAEEILRQGMRNGLVLAVIALASSEQWLLLFGFGSR
jgi:hypothetical protein